MDRIAVALFYKVLYVGDLQSDPDVFGNPRRVELIVMLAVLPNALARKLLLVAVAVVLSACDAGEGAKSLRLSCADGDSAACLELGRRVLAGEVRTLVAPMPQVPSSSKT